MKCICNSLYLHIVLVDHLLETIQKFKETVDSRFIYKNELEKACFQHDIWLMEILRICLEQVLIMYYEIKHLILLKILNLMDTNVLQYIDLL